ncbi:DUF3108 domain-containing protein [Polaromonas sp. CG_23.6]|uniref:DUF3108 domain-containing protein n=1 Tax=Polaromonas sp. CG_23.6 TaxID=2760709 RepID=UPI0024750D5D|nr:DUF3108 domain-containing protein [Polaromonas sp. CG_23.6]MDH6182754.1 hypothetical protein [Polaromonas sp. CG_23.6]
MCPDRLTSDIPATDQIVPRHAAPPWRTLGLLAAGVLAAHALVLQTRPSRFGPSQEPTSRSVAVMTTRSIALPPAAASPPPVQATPPAPTPPKPIVTSVKKPVFKKKMPLAQDQYAQAAIDSIASRGPLPASVDEAPTPPETQGAAPSTELPEAAPAPAPEVPASSATAATPTPPASDAATPSPPPPPPPATQTPVSAMALATSARLDYRMTGSAKGLTYHAQGELLWENAGGSYNARMTVKALFIGSRTMSSTGQISAQGLAPTRFSDKSRTEVAAHFEPDKGQISFSANTPTVPWIQGAQDRVSVFLQLGGMLAGNPSGFPAGSTISTLTVGPRAADNWTFVVEGPELLALPFGETATVKLSRQPRRDYDQKVEIWFAPALDYLPVRSRITQANGDFVDQELSDLTRP